MAYADKRLKICYEVLGAITVNTDVAGFIVPAGKEIEIYNLQAWSLVAGAGTSLMSLVDVSNTILASVTLSHTAGTNAEASQLASGPLKYTNTLTTDVPLKLRVTTLDPGAAARLIVQLDVQDPGSK